MPSSSASSKRSSSASTTTPRTRRPGVLTEIVSPTARRIVVGPPERSLEARAAHLERVGAGQRAGDLLAVEHGRDGLGRAADGVEVDATLTVDEHPDDERRGRCRRPPRRRARGRARPRRARRRPRMTATSRMRSHLLSRRLTRPRLGRRSAQAKKKRGLTPTSPQTGGSPPTIERSQYTQGIG